MIASTWRDKEFERAVSGRRTAAGIHAPRHAGERMRRAGRTTAFHPDLITATIGPRKGDARDSTGEPLCDWRRGLCADVSLGRAGS